MKKSLYIFFILLIIILSFFISGTKAFAREIDYFDKPQIGIWFGVLTPVYTTYSQLSSALGGGAYFRSNTPWSDWKIGIESSYQDYKHKGSAGVNQLTLVPVYGDVLYRIPLPLRLPFTFQLKAGAGGSWVRIKPDDIAQWDPIGMLGFEFSFAAGRRINIGLRLDYLILYEQHIKGAQRNGHVLNAGLTLFFNL